MASLDLWAPRAMYCSGNHIFEVLSFRHRKYVLSSFGVGNQRILWVRIEVFPFKNTGRAFFYFRQSADINALDPPPKLSRVG